MNTLRNDTHDRPEAAEQIRTETACLIAIEAARRNNDHKIDDDLILIQFAIHAAHELGHQGYDENEQDWLELCMDIGSLFTGSVGMKDPHNWSPGELEGNKAAHEAIIEIKGKE
jgi:hypothetical protein